MEQPAGCSPESLIVAIGLELPCGCFENLRSVVAGDEYVSLFIDALAIRIVEPVEYTDEAPT